MIPSGECGDDEVGELVRTSLCCVCASRLRLKACISSHLLLLFLFSLVFTFARNAYMV